VERPAPLGRMSLELGLGDRGRLGNGPGEILPQPHDPGSLLFVGGLEPLRVVVQAGLERLDQRALVLGDLLETLSQVTLCTLEILMPGREPLLDLALHLGERLGEAVAQPLLALLEGHAPRLCKAALLLGVRGHRIGSGACQSPFEVARSTLRLGLDGGRQLGLGALELAIERPAAGHPATKAESADHGEHARDQSRPDDCELGRGVECEGDPRADGGDSDRDAGCDQHPSARKLEGRAGQRRSGADDAYGEGDFEGRLDWHATIVKRLLR
jgi:hypothetical protein